MDIKSILKMKQNKKSKFIILFFLFLNILLYAQSNANEKKEWGNTLPITGESAPKLDGVTDYSGHVVDRIVTIFNDILINDKVIKRVRLAGFKNGSHNYWAKLVIFDDGAEVHLSSGQFSKRIFIKQTDGSYQSSNTTSDSLASIDASHPSDINWVNRPSDNQLEYDNNYGRLIKRVNQSGLSHYF